MKLHWRRILALLPKGIERSFYERFFEKEHAQMLKVRVPFASNLSKHNSLRELGKKYRIKTLVETGTYLGDTLYSLYNDFEKLYSIELSKHFFEKASTRFSSYNKIQLLNGDSGKVLHRLVPQLKDDSLFWLDGHYSGGLTAKGEKDCPIYEELEAIFSSPLNHVIVVDDARLFNGTNSYPSLDDLKNFVQKNKDDYEFKLENDSIRLLPKN